MTFEGYVPRNGEALGLAASCATCGGSVGPGGNGREVDFDQHLDCLREDANGKTVLPVIVTVSNCEMTG